VSARRVEIAPSILSADFLRLGTQMSDALEAGVRLEVHLMIAEPDRYLDAFSHAGATAMMVHVEACPL
jgi:pentose-5-phosphate-3-epimerase